MILSFLTLKGGQGKTTLALNFAFEYKRQGLNVCLVDADNQLSLFDFMTHRQEKSFCDFYKYESIEQLQELNQQYDLIIIDNSPRINEVIDEIIACSDLILIPTKLDMFSFWANVELAKKLKAQNKDMAFIVNMVKHYQSKLKNEFAEGLEKLEVPVLRQKISDSNDYNKALNELKTLAEIKSPKVAEIQLIIQELKEGV